MADLTPVSFKAPVDAVERLDAYCKANELNRSEGLRVLLSLGLDRADLDARVQSVESKLDRLSHIAEILHQYTFIAVGVMGEEKRDLVKKYKEASGNSLVRALVNKFGQ